MSVITQTTATAENAVVLKDEVPAEIKANGTGFSAPWKPWQRVLFRIGFIFLVIMSIPFSAEWYKNLFTIDWFHLHYRDIYDIARFSPDFGKLVPRQLNLLGYGHWLIALFIGIAGGFIWTLADKKNKEYTNLYYWLRVIVRYRAGIGIIGFGFTKLLPVQMPYPSLGLLNTNFGDFTAQKIYWLSIGIVPWYQVFAGVVECAAGAMLFFRRTTTLGAILLFGALGDIVYVNFAYDGGVHVYSSYFVLFAAFLLLYDIPGLYSLLIRERYTVPINYYPSFSGKKWLAFTRIALKSLTIFIFIFVLFYVQLINFWYDPYKQPAMKGVSLLRGNYQVTEFRVNNRLIPYSPLDSVRWHDVTFEKWSSLTFNVNRAFKLDLSNGGGAPMRDINRTFELTGTAGGKRVFYYDADTVNHILYLQDKNAAAERRSRNRNSLEYAPGAAAAQVKKQGEDWIPASSRAYIADEVTAIDKKAWSTRRERGIPQEKAHDVPRKHMVLKYDTTDGSRVVLQGVNDQQGSVYIVLDRINKKYALTDSKLQAGKY